MASSGGRFGKLVVAVLVLGALVGAIAVGLPWYVRRALDEEAKREGVALTVDHVEIGWSQIRLTGIAATMADLPGVRVTLEEGILERNGLAIDHVTARGLDLTLDGAGEPLLEALAKRRGAPISPDARKLPPVHVESGRVQWLKPFGDTSSIEATSLRVDLPSAMRLGDELHATAGKVAAAAAPGKELGPWSARLDQNGYETSFALELVPGAPGSATFKRVISAPMSPGAPPASRWEVELHGQKLSHLGVPGALLGIPSGTDPEVDLTFHHAETSADKAEGALSGSLRGARFVSMSIPADVRFDLAWDGDPAKPLAVRRGSFAVGPFAGDVTGSFTPLPQGFRADLTLKSHPVSCRSLAHAQLTEAGPLGALADAAALPGLVGGDAVLEGSLILDTSAPEKTKLDVSPKSNCSLSFLK